MFLMSRFYRPLQSPLCIFPQNLCRITTAKLLAHLSATYRLLQSRYRLIDADKVFTAIWLQSFKRLRGKPSRALRRLLTAFRYEVKGVSPMEKYGRQFADGKDRKKKTSAKQDYQDSDLGMQQSKCCALPLGDSPKLRERDHLLPDYFREALYSKLSRLCTVLRKTRCCRTHISIFRFPHTGYIHS